MSDVDSNRQVKKLRALPAVEKALADKNLAGVLTDVPRRLAVRTVRTYLDEVRDGLRESADAPGYDPRELERRLRRERRPRLTRAINGLGVVLHTGLGRAPLCSAAQEALADVSSGFSSLEINIDTGRRGDRYEHVESLLCELTGAEAAHVVNNNCAATLLILSSMATGREVIVSRGQLIEIGGGFRIPDVMKQSGARLVEVGTTNRTRLGDYARAITRRGDVLLKVHRSNFRQLGYTEEAGLAVPPRVFREPTAVPGADRDTRPGVEDEGRVHLLCEFQAVGIDIGYDDVPCACVLRDGNSHKPYGAGSGDQDVFSDKVEG